MRETTDILDKSGLNEHYRSFFRIQSEDFRAANLVRLVVSKLDSAKKTIDVGCGTGILTMALMKRGFSVTAVDTSEEMVEMSTEVLQSEGFPAKNLHRMNVFDAAAEFTEHFDQAVCLDVLEHIYDDLLAAKALATLLRPGGCLVITVPAIPSLFGPKDKRVGHYRRYSLKSLISLLEQAGFQINTIRYWNFIGVPVTWFFLRIIKRSVDESFRNSRHSHLQYVVNLALNAWFRWFENPIPFPVGLSLLVVAKKK